MQIEAQQYFNANFNLTQSQLSILIDIDKSIRNQFVQKMYSLIHFFDGVIQRWENLLLQFTDRQLKTQLSSNISKLSSNSINVKTQIHLFQYLMKQQLATKNQSISKSFRQISEEIQKIQQTIKKETQHRQICKLNSDSNHIEENTYSLILKKYKEMMKKYTQNQKQTKKGPGFQLIQRDLFGQLEDLTSKHSHSKLKNISSPKKLNPDMIFSSPFQVSTQDVPTLKKQFVHFQTQILRLTKQIKLIEQQKLAKQIEMAKISQLKAGIQSLRESQQNIHDYAYVVYKELLNFKNNKVEFKLDAKGFSERKSNFFQFGIFNPHAIPSDQSSNRINFFSLKIIPYENKIHIQDITRGRLIKWSAAWQYFGMTVENGNVIFYGTLQQKKQQNQTNKIEQECKKSIKNEEHEILTLIPLPSYLKNEILQPFFKVKGFCCKIQVRHSIQQNHEKK